MKTSKPKAIHIGSLHARAIRGPKDGNQWYWRAERYAGNGGKGTTIWTGWGSPTECTKFLADLISRGEDAQPAPRQADRIETIHDLLDVWLAAVTTSPHLQPRTIENYVRHSRRLDATIGTFRLAAVTAATLEDYETARTKAGFSPLTVAAEMDSLITAWNWGIPRGFCSPQVRLRKPRRKRVGVWDNESTYSPADWWRIVDHMDGWHQMFARLLDGTGARPNEIAHLTWADISEEQMEITIRVSKTGKRVVPIAPDLLDYLYEQVPESQRQGSLWAVPAAGAAHLFREALKRHCGVLGIEYRMPKQVRHLTADRLYRCGVDPKTAGDLLGHSPQTAMKYYRRVTSEDRQRALALAGLGRRPDLPPQVIPLRRSSQPA